MWGMGYALWGQCRKGHLELQGQVRDHATCPGSRVRQDNRPASPPTTLGPWGLGRGGLRGSKYPAGPCTKLTNANWHQLLGVWADSGRRKETSSGAL